MGMWDMYGMSIKVSGVFNILQIDVTIALTVAAFGFSLFV